MSTASKNGFVHAGSVAPNFGVRMFSISIFMASLNGVEESGGLNDVRMEECGK